MSDWKSKDKYLRVMAPVMKRMAFKHKRTIKQVADRYGVTVNDVNTAISEYQPYKSTDINQSEGVIVVPLDRLHDAVQLLNTYHIKARMPAEEFEYVEHYESKL